jgi:hypothetical protein
MVMGRTLTLALSQRERERKEQLSQRLSGNFLSF